MLLELETMKQKYEGWKDEVQRLLPLEREVEQLRLENLELSQQLTLMVEEGERKEATMKEGDSGKKNVMDYDSMMERLTFLQEMRVTNEEELSRLREERASILQENASLREGSQPQLYTNLKKSYEETSARLQTATKLYKEQKKVKEQLEAANLELHQKLLEATDQNMLRSIQERLDRYKKERDTARADCEELDSKLAIVSTDLQSAREQVDEHEKEVTRLKAESSKLDTRLRSYREERNVARDRLKELEHRKQQQPHHQLHHHSDTSSSQDLVATAWHEGGRDVRDGRDIEPSQSPSRELQYGSPVLSYTPDQYSTLSESHHNQPYHKDTESPTPSDDPVSPSPLAAANLRSKSRSSEHYTQPSKPKSESSSSAVSSHNTVEVRTKEGMVMMDIKRASAKLTPKYKPQVVVKRSEGYETGTLMYVGRVNEKEIAGVYTEIRLHSECVCMTCPHIVWLS